MIHANIEELEIRKKVGKTDFWGMISLVLWLLSMQVVLDKGQQYNWFDCAWISWLTGFSICAFVFFIIRELESHSPLINLRLFKDRNFLVGTILSSAINMLIFSSIVLIPQFLQNLMGYTAILSGYALVLRTLPKADLTNGASLHNLCKSTMTAVIASIASTLVARHSQIHQVYLVENLSNFNLVFQQVSQIDDTKR